MLAQRVIGRIFRFFIKRGLLLSVFFIIACKKQKYMHLRLRLTELL